MPTELRLAAPPAMSGLERRAYGLCDHRRGLTQRVREGSDHFGRTAGVEQTPGASEAPPARRLPVRRLAMGAAFKVFQPEALTGQEMLAGQEVRVSSDFADVIFLGAGRVALLLGDAGGKSQVGLCVPQTLRVLRLILSECVHPACALGQLNHYLCGLDLPSAGPVVAMSLAVVDVSAGTAVCACAGSEPPLILRADGGMEAVNAGRIALGVDAGRTFRAVDFLLGTGDALMMATDGITEAGPANGGDSKDNLCYEGMARLALNAFRAGGPPGRMGRKVLDGAQAFAGGRFHDDASVLVAIQR